MIEPRLIVSIVRKGWGDTVLQATMAAGAHGGTVLLGRGVGRNEQLRVFGIQIEPEKEIVLTLVPGALVERMLGDIVRAAELTVPGNGLAMVIDVGQLAGIAHLVQDPSTAAGEST